MKRRVTHQQRSRPAPRAPRLKNNGAGALSLGGVRYLLIRPATLAALQKSVERQLGRRAAECLAAGGRDGGARAISRLAGTGRQRARRLTEMGGAIGWGSFRLERFAADGMVVTVRHSPFAEAYGPSGAPVCHLTRGVLESLANLTLGGRAQVVESRCESAGADHCRFEARVKRARRR
jgi:predicted hydrocarbon binding protein